MLGTIFVGGKIFTNATIPRYQHFTLDTADCHFCVAKIPSAQDPLDDGRSRRGFGRGAAA